MIKDYYQTLQLTPKATSADIANNYRKLALRNHPQSTKEPAAVAAQQFDALAQAYEVLSDPVKRAFLDKYGYEALKEGLYSQGSLKGGYRFGGNSMEIFDNFFKKDEEVGRVLDLGVKGQGSIFGHAFGGTNYDPNWSCPNLIVNVPCVLEELYKGTSKVVTFTRKELNNDGRTTTVVPASKKINIKPGYHEDSVIIFPKEGHQNVHGQTSDLLFDIYEFPHRSFIRKGNDLMCTHTLTLADAFKCNSFTVTTLDNRKLQVPLDEIVSPRYIHEIPQEGMPDAKTGKKGSLYIKFRILFPQSLSEQVRKELRTLLK